MFGVENTGEILQSGAKFNSKKKHLRYIRQSQIRLYSTNLNSSLASCCQADVWAGSYWASHHAAGSTTFEGWLQTSELWCIGNMRLTLRLGEGSRDEQGWPGTQCTSRQLQEMVPPCSLLFLPSRSQSTQPLTHSECFITIFCEPAVFSMYVQLMLVQLRSPS